LGPLHGVKIVELAGIGPGPMAAMLLADLGATVLRIDRPNAPGLGLNRPLQYNLTLRNRASIELDLKEPAARDLVLRLVQQADGLIEGFRPGVTERMGVGPDDCLARNPKLVYGRMTGWGQDGPLSQVAGHDLNYIGLTGVLDSIGRAGQPPTPPLNLVGDFGGGSLYLVLGMLAGIIEARQSGKGQVVDAAIVDGAASLAVSLFGLRAAGLWQGGRGENLLDSGAYFYDVYQCADGKWVSVAPIEKRFHDRLLDLLEIDPALKDAQKDSREWQRARAALADKIKTRTSVEWTALLGHEDVCFAPVHTMEEAAQDPHLQARGTLIDVEGVLQPAPAPRFSRTAAAPPRAPLPVTPENSEEALSAWLSPEELNQWRPLWQAGNQ